MKYHGDSIVFQDQQDPAKCQLVYSSHISVKNVINTLSKFEQELDTSLEEMLDNPRLDASPAVTLYHAATLIRNDIKKCQGLNIDPVHIEDITNEKAKDIIPESVYNLLKSIIAGPKAENQNCTAEEERKVLSLGQDLVYAVSNGRVITPKHIGVGMTVKHKTNSKYMLNLLNHAGHSVSYSEVQKIDKSIANTNKQIAIANDIYIPTNIKKGHGFIHGAADNIDFMEETINGKGTTHATSMVLYQRQTQNENPPAVANVDIPEFPGRVETKPIPVFKRRISKDRFVIRNTQDYHNEAWLTARFPKTKLFDDSVANPPEGQTVPSWTAYNIHLKKADVVVTKSDIGYCPLIHESPTEYSTVYEVMKRM